MVKLQILYDFTFLFILTSSLILVDSTLINKFGKAHSNSFNSLTNDLIKALLQIAQNDTKTNDFDDAEESLKVQNTNTEELISKTLYDLKIIENKLSRDFQIQREINKTVLIHFNVSKMLIKRSNIYQIMNEAKMKQINKNIISQIVFQLDQQLSTIERSIINSHQYINLINLKILSLESQLPISNSSCSIFTNCGSCVADNKCGWCSMTQTCMEGDKNGPKDGSCAFFDYNVCTGPVDCESYKNCGACIKDDSCGWCNRLGNPICMNKKAVNNEKCRDDIFFNRQGDLSICPHIVLNTEKSLIMKKLEDIDFGMKEEKKIIRKVVIDPIKEKTIKRELQIFRKAKIKESTLLSNNEKKLILTQNQLSSIKEDEKNFNYYGLSKKIVIPSKIKSYIVINEMAHKMYYELKQFVLQKSKIMKQNKSNTKDSNFEVISEKNLIIQTNNSNINNISNVSILSNFTQNKKNLTLINYTNPALVKGNHIIIIDQSKIIFQNISNISLYNMNLTSNLSNSLNSKNSNNISLSMMKNLSSNISFNITTNNTSFNNSRNDSYLPKNGARNTSNILILNKNISNITISSNKSNLHLNNTTTNIISNSSNNHINLTVKKTSNNNSDLQKNINRNVRNITNNQNNTTGNNISYNNSDLQNLTKNVRNITNNQNNTTDNITSNNSDLPKNLTKNVRNITNNQNNPTGNNTSNNNSDLPKNLTRNNSHPDNNNNSSNNLSSLPMNLTKNNSNFSNYENKTKNNNSSKNISNLNLNLFRNNSINSNLSKNNTNLSIKNIEVNKSNKTKIKNFKKNCSIDNSNKNISNTTMNLNNTLKDYAIDIDKLFEEYSMSNLTAINNLTLSNKLNKTQIDVLINYTLNYTEKVNKLRSQVIKSVEKKENNYVKIRICLSKHKNQSEIKNHSLIITNSSISLFKNKKYNKSKLINIPSKNAIINKASLNKMKNLKLNNYSLENTNSFKNQISDSSLMDHTYTKIKEKKSLREPNSLKDLSSSFGVDMSTFQNNDNFDKMENTVNEDTEFNNFKMAQLLKEIKDNIKQKRSFLKHQK